MEKRRKNDNGVRKYMSPQAMVALIVLIGIIVTIVANIRTIPGLSKTVTENVSRLDVVETELKFILRGIDEIKQLIKEK